MSIDIKAACFKHRTYVHLGFLPWAFGHGSNDREGQKLALDYITNHLCLPCELRIVHCEEVPDGFRELEEKADVDAEGEVLSVQESK